MRIPRLLRGALAAVLLLAAWGIGQITLPEDAGQEPFVTTTGVGQGARTRNLEATVAAARTADRVSAESGWSAEGNWLVVEVEAAAGTASGPATLALAELRVDGRTYSVTDRTEGIAGTALVDGVPRAGSLAFELPEQQRGGAATLRLSGAADVRSDAVIEVPLDLGALPREQSLALTPAGWAR
ncbi:hypothetical protein [Brachybacterium hainanense]|uniref:DUF4352 domain-containing protein n=1 Tax=Brachybacterium hainanense TaxID=1541174 RepID=A0ABV6R7U7_9MICO